LLDPRNMQNISSISLAASTFPNYFDDLNE
jgi:hypothetical protein